MWKNRLLSKIAATWAAFFLSHFELSHQYQHGRIASKAAILTSVGGDRRRMEMGVVERCSHQQTVYSNQMKGGAFPSEGVEGVCPKETKNVHEKCLLAINRKRRNLIKRGLKPEQP